MFTVVSYDVVDDKRRVKLAKCLLGFGRRVQYSVFECELTPTNLKQLQQKVRDLIDPATDSVRFYFLDAAAVQRIQVLGIGRVTTEPSYYLV
jgi:CRISPR-associated protein Cas2